MNNRPLRKKNITTQDRITIIRLHNNGVGKKDIAMGLDLNIRTISKALKEYSENGILESMPRSTKDLGPDTEYTNLLTGYLDFENFVTIRQLREKLYVEKGIHLSMGRIHQLLHKANYTFKCVGKEPFGRNKGETILARAKYAEPFLNSIINNGDDNVFYLDEVGFNGNFVHARGWALSGVTPVALMANLNNFRTSCCALMSKWGIVAVKFLRGGFSCDSFKEFGFEIGARFAAEGITNARIIMDNVRFHKNAEACQGFYENNITLEFIPPYSPFLNPIENLFSKWKRLVTIELQNCIDDIRQIATRNIPNITQQDCHNYYANAHSYLIPSIRMQDIEHDPSIRVPVLTDQYRTGLSIIPNPVPAINPPSPGLRNLLEDPIIVEGIDPMELEWMNEQQNRNQEETLTIQHEAFINFTQEDFMTQTQDDQYDNQEVEESDN